MPRPPTIPTFDDRSAGSISAAYPTHYPNIQMVCIGPQEAGSFQLQSKDTGIWRPGYAGEAFATPVI